MGPRSRSEGGQRRRLLLGAGPPLAAAGIAAGLLAVGGTSAGASNAAAPVYSALAGNAPSGLALVESHRPSGAGEPPGPTFPAQPPEGASGWPVASSIRRLSIGEPGLSAWIARADGGGICVLLYDGRSAEGVSAIDMGCSPAASAGRGASVEVSDIPGMPGRVIAAGVVPDGVTAVSEVMADGSTATSAVSGNAWARIAEQAAATGEEPNEITGG